MSKPAAPDVFLGRQPILNRCGQVVAHELLFRSEPDQSEAHLTDDAIATAQVIARAFNAIGIHTVVGGSRAFINLDAELLLSRLVERLPQDRVVFEILETVEVDDRLIRRCRALRARGYRFALDDLCGLSESQEPLLDLVDIVKIDVLRLDPASLERLVRRLRYWPAQLLAEKVETPVRARLCLALGFDLFQGFLYGRPQILTA
jgi:EAL and modified HD-GYP domain-containing signal transduction protein